MPKVVTPQQPSGFSEALDALAGFGQGMVVADEINRRREVEDRDYSLDLDRFNEQLREFDTAHAEQVRQFDEMTVERQRERDFTGDQAGLDRSLNRETREDIQEFEDRVREDTQVFEGYEQEQFRQVDRYRIYEDSEAEKRRMVHTARANQLDRWQSSILGSHSSFDEIPDYHIRTSDGKVVPPGAMRGETELLLVAAGRTSTLIKNMTKEQAQEIIDGSKELGAADKAEYYKSALLETDPDGNSKFLHGIIPNDQKWRAIDNELYAQLGYNEQKFNALKSDPAQYEAAKNALIHGLNSTEPMRRALRNEEIEYQAEVRANELKYTAEGLDRRAGSGRHDLDSDPYYKNALGTGTLSYFNQGVIQLAIPPEFSTVDTYKINQGYIRYRDSVANFARLNESRDVALLTGMGLLSTDPSGRFTAVPDVGSDLDYARAALAAQEFNQAIEDRKTYLTQMEQDLIAAGWSDDPATGAAFEIEKLDNAVFGIASNGFDAALFDPVQEAAIKEQRKNLQREIESDLSNSYRELERQQTDQANFKALRSSPSYLYGESNKGQFGKMYNGRIGLPFTGKRVEIGSEEYYKLVGQGYWIDADSISAE